MTPLPLAACLAAVVGAAPPLLRVDQTRAPRLLVDEYGPTRAASVSPLPRRPRAAPAARKPPSYAVTVVDRALGPDGGPIISSASNSSAFVDNFNAAWLPLEDNDDGGALFVRVTNTDVDAKSPLGGGCEQTSPTSNQSHSSIAFTKATSSSSLEYESFRRADIPPMRRRRRGRDVDVPWM